MTDIVNFEGAKKLKDTGATCMMLDLYQCLQRRRDDPAKNHN